MGGAAGGGSRAPGARGRLVDVAVTAVDGIGAVPPTFPVTVLSLLCEQIDAVGGAWHRVDRRTGEPRLLLQCHPQVSTPTVRRAMGSLRHEDPRVVALTRSGPVPVTGEQAAGSGPAWRRSPCCRFLSTLVESPQLVCVGLRAGGTEVCGLAFVRSGQDFTPAVLQFLAEVQPVLQAVDRCVARLSPSSDLRPPGVETGVGVRLTSREREVLELVAQGLTAVAVSRRLGCSPRTVHKHVGHVFQKLEVHDRLGAVLEAQRLGLLPGAPPALRPAPPDRPPTGADLLDARSAELSA